MPDINQMPVSIDEFMYPKSDQSASDSASEAELSYSNYYTMIPNIPNASMAAAAMAHYNPTTNTMSDAANEVESKEKENISPDQNQNG